METGMKVGLMAAALALCVSGPVAAGDWDATVKAARGQTVYWNAWGGDERTNAFITWVGEETKRRYGVDIRHVKLTSTTEAVTRVVSEKAAGRTSGGTVDLIWINGPNFLAMKTQGLLHGPFVADLPNAKYLDLSPTSANSVDFTVPVEGMESPWRLAKFVFNYDTARVATPPATLAAFPEWAAAHPGRFTHPHPSDFIGATFLKQALVELAPDPEVLSKPVTDATFEATTAPLWDWYDRLRPNLWRGGASYPENQSVLQQLLNDGEVDIGLSFDPASAAAAIRQGLLPETVRVFVPKAGSIGNVSFVAIPFNAAHKEGAKVVANFLLDPAVQARMQNIDVLGSFSVLDPNRLDADAKAAFAALPTAPALPTLQELGPTLAEPHASWMTRLTEAWAKRYTK
jgi:putative thiamine transport system substrate-binding protein